MGKKAAKDEKRVEKPQSKYFFWANPQNNSREINRRNCVEQSFLVIAQIDSFFHIFYCINIVTSSSSSVHVIVRRLSIAVVCVNLNRYCGPPAKNGNQITRRNRVVPYLEAITFMHSLCC